jgi:Mg2+ and Co2+ transporter CorA
MWKKIWLFLLFAYCLPCAVPAVEADQWYLITESELQSIEAYKRTSEQEKQTWLLQVQSLNRRAGNLQSESASLNRQLQDQRERNRKLTLSFNEYEAGQSLLMSQKDTQILKLQTENNAKKRTILALTITVVLGALIIFGFWGVNIPRRKR